MASTSDPAPPRIAIIGAGPGGLLLARYLQLHHLPVTVYERELGRHSRSQGGSLDLHTGSGQKALRACGLYDQFRAVCRSEGEQSMVVAKDGTVLYDSGPEETSWLVSRLLGDRPEVDRRQLRRILLDSLEEGTIKWNHHFASAAPLPSGGYDLHFHGRPTPITVDVLIGADGAWSHVRPLVTPIQPVFSGLTFVDFVLSPSHAASKEVDALAGRGSSMILGEKKGIIVQRSSKETRLYVALPFGEPWEDFSLPPKDPVGAHAKLVALFPGWDPKVLALLQPSYDDPEELPKVRKIFALPPGLTWEGKSKGVTVIGDAAHVMSPFAGEGVNLALLDALELGKALVGALPPSAPLDTDRLDNALRKFERRMFKRAKASGEESETNLKMCFEDDAAQKFAKVFRWYGLVGQLAVPAAVALVAIAVGVTYRVSSMYKRH